jgi:hypothetical protein
MPFSLKVPALPAGVKDKSQRTLDLLARLKHGLFSLSLPQKLYSLAFLLLFINENLVWVALISIIAMGLEFWPLFERVWHSLAGKALLLLFYAIIANFALATSAALVNEVVGVSASHLDYTHNFALLLYIPAWFVVVTAIVLLAMQILIPCYYLVSIALKPLGVQTIRFTQYDKFRKLTAMVRLVLASIVLHHLSMLIDIENTLELTEGTVVNLAAPLASGEDRLVLQALEEQINKTVAEQTVATNQSKESSADAINAQENDADATDADEIEQGYTSVRLFYKKRVREWIAQFAYALEADSQSRCKKAKGSSVVELNDYEVLEIRQDKRAKYGYRFEVKKCVSAAFPLR